MNCLDCGSTMERGGTFAVNDVRAHQIEPGYTCPDCSTALKEAPIPACLGYAVTAIECEEREARKLQLVEHTTALRQPVWPPGHIVVATRSQVGPVTDTEAEALLLSEAERESLDLPALDAEGWGAL